MSGAANPFRRQTVTLGTITPSANIVVERITTAILADFPEVSGHFSRTPVVGASDPYGDSYDWEGMLGAARLLGHARLDVICWNGSKGGSLGFDVDRALCARITAETGAPATTSTLAIERLFKRDGVRRYALVTPYVTAYQTKIIRQIEREGYECVAEAHAGCTDNLSYIEVPDREIERMIIEVAKAKPQAIIAYCTNFPAAPLVDALERKLDIPIYDSVAVGVWDALRLAGIDTARGRRWGRVFAT
jgi:maleate isomerase